MSSVETISRAPSIVPGAIRCTFSEQSLHQILDLVRRVRPRGTVRWLRRVTGRSPRAVKYWLAGETAMGGDAALAILRALRIEIDKLNSELRQFELDLR